MSKNETRDEVGSADDFIWVKEAERAILEGWNELEPIEPLGFPSRPVSLVDLEPANPHHIHPDFIQHCQAMENVDFEDSKDLGIGVWVVVVL